MWWDSCTKLISSLSSSNSRVTHFRSRNKWWSMLLHNGSLLLATTFIMMIAQCTVEGVNDGGKKVLKMIYGVNAGGSDHVDVHGFRYMRDPLNTGVASDYGNRLSVISRSFPQDEPLYRTERYSESSFGYDIPIPSDGDYVLVMKFAEVYFQRPGQKVFDVELNRHHLIVSDLDIFAKAGFGTAHQEVVPFTVKGGQKTLEVNGEKSSIKKGSIRLDFLKGPHDNPKINAFFVVFGEVDDIPPLPTPAPTSNGDLDLDDFEEDEYEMNLDDVPETQHASNDHRGGGQRRYRRSGSRVDDPWSDEPMLASFVPLFATVASSFLLIAVTVKFFRGL